MAGKSTISTSDTKYDTLKLSSSSYGVSVPIAWGKTRISSNLIDYVDFTATAHTTTTSSGGKGGGVTQKNTTYTYDVCLVMALCEGAIGGVEKAWVSKKVKTLDEIDMALWQGVRPQVAWDYLRTNHAGQTFTGDKTEIIQLDATATYMMEGWTTDKGVYKRDPDNQDNWIKLAKISSGSPTNAQYLIAAGVYTFHSDLAYDDVKITATGTFVHDNRAIPYSGMAYVAGKFDLGNDATLPNFTFEVYGNKNFSSTIPDAHPKEILVDFLTNQYYGAGFPSDLIGDWTQYQTYCTAHGLFLSPALVEQQEAQEFIAEMMTATNSQTVWSEGKLKIIPYGDEAVTGNDVTFTPNNLPLYDLTLDDFLAEDTDDPVKIVRTTEQDAYNQVQVEFLNRDNEYNIEIMPASDAADIEDKGLRPKDAMRLHCICDPDIARTVAQLTLQRALFVRNVYEFKLDWKYVLLEPMDVVTLTEPTLGLDRELVRIVEIEENDEGTLTVRAEECPVGVAASPKYPNAKNNGVKVNYNVPAGKTEATIFTAPDALTAKGLELWIGASGGSIWGGCQVWVSEDGDTYKRLGVINSKVRRGMVTADLPMGAAIDTANTLSVQMDSSQAQLLSGTQADADNLRTLCYLDGEFLAYKTATLTGTNAYNLTYLVRGAYNSPITAHTDGKSFVRVEDAALLKYEFDLNQIGKTLYVKFLSFNIYGSGVQNLADVNPVRWVISWRQPPSVSNIQLLEDTYILKDGTVLTDIDVKFTEPAYAYLSHYNIWYDVNNGGIWTLAGKVVDGSGYKIKALPNTSSIKVRVETVNKAGYSNSGQVSSNLILTGKSNPPSDVTGLSAVIDPLDRTRVILTWQPVTDLDLRGYRILEGTTELTPSPITDTRYVYIATSSRQHIFGVYSMDNSGNTSALVTTLVVPVTVEPPNVASISAVQQDTDRSQLILDWTAVQISDLAHYEVRRGGTGWENAQIVEKQVKSNRLIYQLTTEGSQIYMIKAVTVGGHESVSAASVTVQVTLRPDTPASIVAVQEPRDKSMLKISWSASAGNDIAGYDIFINSVQITVERNTNHWWTIPESGTYMVAVRARTVAGYVSNFVNTSVSPMIEADDVTGFTAVQQLTDRTLVRLMWDASSGDVAYHEIRKGVSWDAGQIIGNQISGTFFDTIVLDEAMQVFWIKAVTYAGKYSQNPAKHDAIFSLNPAPVSDIQLSQDPNDRSILNISFTATPEADLSNYEIRAGSSWSDAVEIGKTKELRWTYSPPSTGDVKIMIKAVNAAGFYSDEVFASLYVTLEPNDVTGFRVFQNGEKLAFVWTQSDDNDVIGYELREGSNFDNGTIIATGITLTQYQLPVDMEILRRFHIKAINRSGHYSRNAAYVSVTITDLPPKNVINSYDEVVTQDGVHTGTEFGASLITFATLGGTFADYPSTKFSDIGGATVLKLLPKNLVADYHFDGAIDTTRWRRYSKITDATNIVKNSDGNLLITFPAAVSTGLEYLLTGTVLERGMVYVVEFKWRSSKTGTSCGFLTANGSYAGSATPQNSPLTNVANVWQVDKREFTINATGVEPTSFMLGYNTKAIGDWIELEYIRIYKKSGQAGVYQYEQSGTYACTRKDMGQVITANIATVFQPSILYTSGTTASLEYRTSRGNITERQAGTVGLTTPTYAAGQTIQLTQISGLALKPGDVTTWTGGGTYHQVISVSGNTVTVLALHSGDAGTYDFYVDSPSNWTDWQPFSPVEATFRYIEFKVDLTTQDTASTPEVNQLIIRVDVPDKDIAKSVVIPAGGATVPYGYTFYELPVVTPMAEGSAVRAVWSNKTTSSVVINVINNSTGADVGGNVDFRVKGY